MFTIRNIGGVALFLAGTTWMWLTPAFAAKGVSTSGAAWSITQILCYGTIVGFSIATWGLFAQHGWWETLALLSATIGAIAVIPYWIANIEGGATVGATAYNAVIHVLMAVGVFVLLLVPRLEHWVDSHVMASM